MKKLLTLLLILLLLPRPVTAEEAYREVYDSEDLKAIAQNPTGKYRLMADVELGFDWTPLYFAGELDGNGFVLLNGLIEDTGTDRRETKDGNRKSYDTVFAGLFSVCEGAYIHDLTMLGTAVRIQSGEHCFAAGLAGYSKDSIIENCHLSVAVQLNTTAVNVGVGGFVGYSDRTEFTNCSLEGELVFVDENREESCEEFLGGYIACGTGRITGCQVKLRGYASIYGYAHNGGFIGMYKQLGSGKYQGLLKDSSTDTVIRFFEKAPERRAYCHGYVGENANKECKISDCRVIAYERQEERKDFDTLILPETCENPRYSEESVRGSCQSNGYTQFVCQGCGYCIKGHYTPRIHTYRTEVLSRSCTEGDLLLLSCETCVESKEERTEPRGHSRGEWQLLTPPQVGIEGLEGVLCSVCGELLEQRAVPALESTPEPKISVSLQEPIETPEPTNMPTASAEAKAEETLSLWDWILKYILFGWLFNK